MPSPSAAEGTYNPTPGGTSVQVCSKCEPGHASASGAARCTICAADYYRPTSASSVDECTRCSAIRGVGCATDTTIETLNLTSGYWRHSNATTQTHLCKSDGSWTPCVGGNDAGAHGDGYCAPGYRGLRCELCTGPAYSKHFDTLKVRCEECGEVAARTAAIFSTLLLVLLVGFGASTALRRVEGSEVCNALRKWAFSTHAAWETAGMRFKVKVFVGLCQCIAAVPSVYNVTPPEGLEEYSRWIDLFELPSEIERIFIPTACVGNYRTRIWLGSCWPGGLILLLALGFVSWELLLNRYARVDERGSQRICAAIQAGLRRTLPLMLGLTFLVLPSTSSRLFKTFRCESIEYGEGELRRYLKADLQVLCDTAEHGMTRAIAFFFIGIWPVAIPLLYVALLLASRKALVSGITSPLAQATAFLWDDCTYASVRTAACCSR